MNKGNYAAVSFYSPHRLKSNVVTDPPNDGVYTVNPVPESKSAGSLNSEKGFKITAADRDMYDLVTPGGFNLA